MKFPHILKKLRSQDNINQNELAKAIGVSRSTIGMYEAGKREPDFETMEAIADYFNVTMDYLHGKDTEIKFPANIIPLPNMNKIPLLGDIACGEPILAEENIECNIDIPEDITADFALRCKGNSMIDARILDGDIVYIKQQPTVNNGEIAAILIGDEATLKKVYLTGDTLTLLACNSAYEPFVYTGTELENIKILGKAVGFTSKI